MRDIERINDDFQWDEDDYVSPTGSYVSGAWPAVAVGVVAMVMAVAMAVWPYM